MPFHQAGGAWVSLKHLIRSFSTPFSLEIIEAGRNPPVDFTEKGVAGTHRLFRLAETPKHRPRAAHLSAGGKKSGTAGCAVPEGLIAAWWGCRGLRALVATGAAAVARAAALALAAVLAAAQAFASAVAQAFASAVARAATQALGVAIALAGALVAEALAGALVAASPAFLAASAGVSRLRERESGGNQQAGDDGDERFRFHIVVWC